MARKATSTNEPGRASVPAPVDFERLLATFSTRFIHLPAEQIDQHVESLLGATCELFELDRSSVSEGTGANEQHRVTHRWFRPGLEPQEAVSGAELSWLARRLAAGEAVILSDVAELPAEAAQERAFVARFGQRSWAVLPLAAGGRALGAIAFATVRAARSWLPGEVARLKLVAEIVAGALARRDSELALRRSLEENEELRRQLETENRSLREEISEGHGFEEIVGRSAVLRAALHRVGQVAETDSPVLFLGETGTGKELFAKALHSRSRRAGHPLIVVNCAALPATLIEAELFGHERGAFTGALQTRLGRFELAAGGTLFLDEIGELELALQAKLLRVLQDGEVQRVGAARSKKVDVRVVAATSRKLREASRDGSFRSDLYYRLSVFPIELPSLRERRDDIPLLVWHFVQSKQKPLGRTIERVPDSTMRKLAAYDWPGNVRELENVIERALILACGPVLEVSDAILFGETAAPAAAEPAGDNLEAAERAHILGVLERCDWTIEGGGHAADRLGLNPSTLRNRMRKLGLRRPSEA